MPIPTLGDFDVLVKLKASALCRSDLYLYHGSTVFQDAGKSAAITPGHEPCGVVERVGSGVTRVKPGDRIAVYLALGCGTCPQCLEGYPMLCQSFRCLGFDLDGAHADYTLVPEYNCLPLPDSMSFVTGALATDVGGTLYTACKRLNVSGRTTLAIFGVGPMGIGGVLMAKANGARVIAVDAVADRLEYARKLGADEVVNPKECDAVQTIRNMTRRNGGVDVAIDCSGNQKAIQDALDCTRVEGKVGLIGESKSITVNVSDQFLRKLLEVSGCWYFRRGDWDEITDFIIRKNVELEKIASHKFALKDAAEAFKLFDSYGAQKVVFTWV